MGALKDGLKIGAWVTDRIDQFAAYITKKVRINEVNKINQSVDSGDDKSVNNILRDVVKKSDDRLKAGS
jgi:hypothetical protein